MDWTGLKREDWSRLSEALGKAGLPSVIWRNGEPIFERPLTEAEAARVQEIAAGVGDRVIVSPLSEPVTPKAGPAPVQKQKGWPKGKKRK